MGWFGALEELLGLAELTPHLLDPSLAFEALFLRLRLCFPWETI